MKATCSNTFRKSEPLEEVSFQDSENVKLTLPDFQDHENPKIVTPDWKGKEIANFRKSVYNWWSWANDVNKDEKYRSKYAGKSRKAFAWFEDHGATVEVKPGGKVTILFPKE